MPPSERLFLKSNAAPDAGRLCRPPRVRGIALPLVLLFLLIITIAATFGIRRATLNEGITRNQLDYEVSRQAAEAALRDGERDANLQGNVAGATCARGAARPISNVTTGMQFFSSNCASGQCRMEVAGSNSDYYDASNYAANPPINPQPWWPMARLGRWNGSAVYPVANCVFNGAVPIGTYTAVPPVRGVARQPEYLIEYLVRGTDATERNIRVTARGFGADINTETVVQSYYRPLGLTF